MSNSTKFKKTKNFFAYLIENEMKTYARKLVFVKGYVITRHYMVLSVFGSR